MEEEIADQTDDENRKYRFKNCRTSKNVCLFHSQISIVKDGEEVFQIKQEPADYKMDFDYWGNYQSV